MSLAQALSTYITLNLLIGIGFTSLFILTVILGRIDRVIKAKSELKLHYAILTFLLTLIATQSFLPRSRIFEPAARVWSAQSIKTFSRDYTAGDKGGYISAPLPGKFSVNADAVLIAWLMIGSLLALIGGAAISRDLRNLFKIKRNAFLVKKIGRTAIYVNDQIKVPFSYWVPGEANIILPSGILGNRANYRIMVAHELQHHRHGDTKWLYVFWVLSFLCILNPFIHWWNRWIREIQEFACDETLVDQKKVEAQAYARCLIEAAETAIGQKYVPVCATGLVFLLERNMLKRRINNMVNQVTKRTGRAIGLSFVLATISLMTITAFAANGLVQDRRVNLAQAQTMALKAQGKSGFPIVVNDLVLKQLNRFIGTPEGRELMRNSLQRMENYKESILRMLQSYNAPEELMAVPLIESGYQNLTQEQSGTYMLAAGLWQFVPLTARKYGLHVLKQSDERLSLELSTDAAIRYLLSNWLRFKDWQLAIFAYNAGEEKVQRGIDETGSRDAWTLIRHGYEGDSDYLAKLMAAVLIMRNPESLQ